jgi:hypothetical protein
MNSTWKDITFTQLYEQAGVVHRAFIKMLWNYDQSIYRNKFNPSTRITLNPMWLGQAYLLTNLPQEIYRQYFGSGRFPSLHQFCQEFKKANSYAGEVESDDDDDISAVIDSVHSFVVSQSVDNSGGNA